VALIDVPMIVTKSTHITPSIKRTKHVNASVQPIITFYILFLVCFSSVLKAQPFGIRSGFTAGLSSTITSDPWAVFSNPAAMPSKRWIILGVQRNFGLSELNEVGFSLGLPVSKQWITSMGSSSYGWSRMRLWRISQGIKFSNNRVDLGLVSQWNGILVPDPYQSDSAILIKAGGQFALNDEFRLGFHMHNLSFSTWKHSKDPIEQQLSAGLAWQAHPDIVFHVQLSSSDQFSKDQILALEWEPIEDLRLGLGFGSQPTRVSFGMSLKKGNQQFGWMANNYTRLTKAWTQAAEIGVYR
jgi:hypothetical protein